MQASTDPLGIPARRQRRAVLILTTLGFAAAIVGFFLSWGGYTDSTQIPGTGELVIISRHYTGADAGHYGYLTLMLGIAGAAVGTWWLLRGPFEYAKAALVAMAWIGLALLTVVVRNDSDVKVFGTVGYALSTGDYTLGYTSGAGLAVIGFLVAAVAAILLPGTKASAPPL